MEGVQPALTTDDVVDAELALKANKQFLALMQERYGITDMATLAVDPWCALAPRSQQACPVLKSQCSDCTVWGVWAAAPV